jgi:hypothetical protein
VPIGIVLAVLVALFSFANRPNTDRTAPPVEIALVDQEETACPPFNKELFVASHRAAANLVNYVGGDIHESEELLRELRAELSVIETAISSEPEKEVHTLLSIVANTKAERHRLIDLHKRIRSNAAEIHSKLTPDVIDVMARFKGVEYARQYTGYARELDQMLSEDFIMVGYNSPIAVELGDAAALGVLKRLSDQYQLPIVKGQHADWISCTETAKLLDSMAAGSLKTAGTIINNGGKLPDR